MTSIERARIAVNIADYLEVMRQRINDTHLTMANLQTFDLSEDNRTTKITDFDCEMHNESVKMIETQLHSLELNVSVVQGLLEEIV